MKLMTAVILLLFLAAFAGDEDPAGKTRIGSKTNRI